MVIKDTIENVIDHLEAIGTGLKYLLAKKRLTVMYPEVLQELPPLYRGMLKYNSEKCISCSLCAMICPANAIKMYKVDEKKRRPGITYTRCIFCGFCVDICPAFALEFSDVHDVAYYTLEEQTYKPEEFEKGPPRPLYKKIPRKVKVKIDEEVGLKYEFI